MKLSSAGMTASKSTSLILSEASMENMRSGAPTQPLKQKGKEKIHVHYYPFKKYVEPESFFFFFSLLSKRDVT